MAAEAANMGLHAKVSMAPTKMTAVLLLSASLMMPEKTLEKKAEATAAPSRTPIFVIDKPSSCFM